MFIFELFNRKKTIIKDGEEILDLVTPVIKYTAANIRVQSFVKVTTELEMRPDLIAYQSYGSDAYTDVLLKYNGISNAFSVQEGDVIAIPYLDDMLNNFVTNDNSREDLRSNFIDPSKLSQKDQNRITYLQNKAKEKGLSASQPLPPNFAQPGTSEVSIKDGIVTFGNNNSIKTECQDVLSKSEFKAKMLKKKIANEASENSINNTTNK